MTVIDADAHGCYLLAVIQIRVLQERNQEFNLSQIYLQVFFITLMSILKSREFNLFTFTIFQKFITRKIIEFIRTCS